VLSLTPQLKGFFLLSGYLFVFAALFNGFLYLCFVALGLNLSIIDTNVICLLRISFVQLWHLSWMPPLYICTQNACRSGSHWTWDCFKCHANPLVIACYSFVIVTMLACFLVYAGKISLFEIGSLYSNDGVLHDLISYVTCCSVAVHCNHVCVLVSTNWLTPVYIDGLAQKYFTIVFCIICIVA